MAHPNNYIQQLFKPLDPKSNVHLSENICYNANHGTIEVAGITDKSNLYHYIPIRRVMQNLDCTTPSMVFINPELWKDVYEKKLFEAALKMCNSIKHIYCLCTTYAFANNIEAMWLRNSSPLQTQVRLSINFKKWINYLDSFSNNKDVDIYVSLVDYSLDQKDIDKVVSHLKNSVTLPDDCVSAMSLKRKAFAYECEVRIFIITKSDKTHHYESLRDLFTMPFQNFRDIITSVQLPPHDPSNEDLDNLLGKYDRWITQDVAIDIARDKIKQLFLPKLINISQSQIYKNK